MSEPSAWAMERARAVLGESHAGLSVVGSHVELGDSWLLTQYELALALDAVRAEERERCAKAAEQWPGLDSWEAEYPTGRYMHWECRDGIAAAIRADVKGGE